MSLDPELVRILVCPVTRTPLRHDEKTGRLVSDEGGLSYPVRGAVPILLVEEARPWPPEQAGGQSLPRP